MGIKTSIRVKYNKEKMKLSSAVIVAVASAQNDEKKVPPRHPMQRLARLTEFSEEILTNHFEFLPSQTSWINKFKTNSERMGRNFERGQQRCGYYDETQLPHGGPENERKRRDLVSLDDLLRATDRYNRVDPEIGIKQITTGFRKWAERYLGNCSGQRNYAYQINRMNRWNGLLQKHLENNKKMVA